MYKGYKVTKRLQRYMGYIKNKYEKLRSEQEVDLWDIFEQYEFIMRQPKCIQMFLYDLICDEFVHHGEYSVIRSVNGELYVRKLNKCEIQL